MLIINNYSDYDIRVKYLFARGRRSSFGRPVALSRTLANPAVSHPPSDNGLAERLTGSPHRGKAHARARAATLPSRESELFARRENKPGLDEDKGGQERSFEGQRRVRRTPTYVDDRVLSTSEQETGHTRNSRRRPSNSPPPFNHAHPHFRKRRFPAGESLRFSRKSKDRT